MKKLLLFAIIVGGSIAFTSCSKDETCVCADGTEWTDSDIPSVGGIGLSLEQYCTACGGTIE